VSNIRDSDAAAHSMPGQAGLIALLLCSLFPLIGLFAIGIDLPRIADAFKDEPNAQLLAQLIGGGTGLAFALSSPLVGYLIDRFGYRNIYIGSLFIFAAIGVLPAFLDNLPLIVITRFILGVSVAGTITAGMSGLGKLPDNIRARMFGRNAMVSSLGAIICFPLVGRLAALGWRVPFAIHLIALLVIPLALTLPSERRIPQAARPVRARGLGVSTGLLLLAAFVGLTMFFGPSFAPFYLVSIGITDPELASVHLVTMSCCSLIMTTSYGWLHSRFGTTSLFWATLFLVGCGLVSAGFSSALPVFAASMGLVACGLAIFTPNLGSAISASSGGNPGRGIGWAMSAMFAVQVLFPFIAESIRATLGTKWVFLCFGAVSLVLACWFGISVYLRKGKEAQERL